jgi:hypothetical protein
MKKIWIYISAFLLGVIAGLITMYKLMGEQIKVSVRKVKQKRTSGTSSVSIPIEVKVRERVRKQPKAKGDKKQARKARKSNKKL